MYTWGEILSYTGRGHFIFVPKIGQNGAEFSSSWYSHISNTICVSFSRSLSAPSLPTHACVKQAARDEEISITSFSTNPEIILKKKKNKKKWKSPFGEKKILCDRDLQNNAAHSGGRPAEPSGRLLQRSHRRAVMFTSSPEVVCACSDSTFRRILKF